MRPLVLVLLLASCLVAVQQAETQDRTASARASGKALFKQYCASCHGDDAKGAGPAAVAFKVQPPDLTVLSPQNHGKFPRERVVQAIRGDRKESAHGSTDMPVWGPMFLGLAGMNEVQAERHIQDVTEYIKSVQVK